MSVAGKRPGGDSFSGELQAQLSAPGQLAVRPRLTGLLRARLYPPELVHFDLDQESIVRFQALSARRSSAGQGKPGGSSFTVLRFAPASAPEREKRDGREAFNNFVTRAGKVAGEELDRMAACEFLYDAVCGPDAPSEEDKQIKAIQEVLISFDRSSFGQIRRLAETLARFDRGGGAAAAAGRGGRGLHTGEREMDHEFGESLGLAYPLDGAAAAPSAAAVPADRLAAGLEERQELFFHRAKALVAGDSAKAGAAPRGGSAPSGRPRQPTLAWFRGQCELHLVQQQSSSGGGGASSSSSAAAPPGGGAPSLTVEELMGQLLEMLECKPGEEPDQNALLELLGFEAFELLTQLLEKRDALLEEWGELKKRACTLVGQREAAAGPAPPQSRKVPGVGITVTSESEKRNAKLRSKAAQKAAREATDGNNTQAQTIAALRLLASIGIDGEEADEGVLKPKVAAPKAKAATGNLYQSNLAGMGLRLVLPEGTERKMLKGYEKVTVPAAPTFDHTTVELRPVRDMPEWARVAFKGTESLNTIQSIVYNAAFGRSQNMLICAPTGAGKTNIAVLCILRLIGQHMDAAGGVGRDFKGPANLHGAHEGARGRDRREVRFAARAPGRAGGRAHWRHAADEEGDRGGARDRHGAREV
ncbi:unnamed protein product [Prorocentrum cordatum]|uniref:Activating signal cointegrator 1 complex subunit 3 n=1 Tax=Prorocentrum cordatum TaxID=2364126 RepID=A0ABN9SJ75_9DINO|nr:unnamed protein product [Polarella glacialis]